MGFPPSMISGIEASISYPDLNQIMALALKTCVQPDRIGEDVAMSGLSD